KNVKNGWAGSGATLGSCAFNDVNTDDSGTTACTAAWNATNDVRITETGTGSVKLAATTGTEGFAYLITTGTTLGVDAANYFDTSIDSTTEDSSKIAINGQGTPFQIQTGYYIGDGNDNRTVTGVGFQPDVVLVKSDTILYSARGVKWKSSSMTNETTNFL